MSRRLIVTKAEIHRRRGDAWARYYACRGLAVGMMRAGWNGENIARTLERYPDYACPEVGIDGWLLDTPMQARREHEADLLKHFRLTDRVMLCPYFWTEKGWMEYVRMYQALPDVFEDYYFKYEPMPIDRLRLVPMSSKPKQGTGISASKKVQVPYFVS